MDHMDPTDILLVLLALPVLGLGLGLGPGPGCGSVCFITMSFVFRLKTQSPSGFS